MRAYYFSKTVALPSCNVIVQAADEGQTEIAAVDPVASMEAIESEALGTIAGKVQEHLQ